MNWKVGSLIVLDLLFGAEESLVSGYARPCRSIDRYDAIILHHAQRRGLNPRFVKAIIAAESEFKPRARSPRGARGLMQLMPRTAAQLGTPPHRLIEPEANIAAGTAYLDALFKETRARYGLRATRLCDAPAWVQRRVAAGYNGGWRCLYRKQWPPETRRYVRNVGRLSRSPVSALSHVDAPPSRAS